MSVNADDLDESPGFYEQLFGLRRIPTPTYLDRRDGGVDGLGL